MKFVFNVSPNMRQKMSTQKIMLELMLGLLVVFAFSLVYYQQAYGTSYMMQAIMLLVVSILVAFVTEVVWSFVMKKEKAFTVAYVRTYLNGSFGWISALILTLMCPINIRPYALAVSTFIAIFFGKLLFGGFGNNIFNPAALGRAIVFATFLGATTDVITTVTPTTIIANDFNWLVSNPEMITKMMGEIGGLSNLLFGWYPGAIGETSVLVIALVGIYLAVRRVIDYRVPLMYVGAIFVLTSCVALFRGVASYNGMPGFIWYPLLHIATGGVVFGAVFMLTDPVTSPTSAPGRCIFALGAAIITVLIRIKANLPEGCLYSILIMNMLSPMIEAGFQGKHFVVLKKARIAFGLIAIVGIGSVLLASSAIEAKEPEPKVMLATNDRDVLKLKAKVDSKKENTDGTMTFVISAQGYASIENPDTYNIFEIIVNTKDTTIVSIKPTTINDTEKQGDKIDNPIFLKQFIGLKLDNDVTVEKNDAVSKATISARSALRAVTEVRKAFGY